MEDSKNRVWRDPRVEPEVLQHQGDIVAPLTPSLSSGATSSLESPSSLILQKSTRLDQSDLAPIHETPSNGLSPIDSSPNLTSREVSSDSETTRQGQMLHELLTTWDSEHLPLAESHVARTCSNLTALMHQDVKSPLWSPSRAGEPQLDCPTLGLSGSARDHKGDPERPAPLNDSICSLPDSIVDDDHVPIDLRSIADELVHLPVDLHSIADEFTHVPVDLRSIADEFTHIPSTPNSPSTNARDATLNCSTNFYDSSHLFSSSPIHARPKPDQKIRPRKYKKKRKTHFTICPIQNDTQLQLALERKALRTERCALALTKMQLVSEKENNSMQNEDWKSRETQLRSRKIELDNRETDLLEKETDLGLKEAEISKHIANLQEQKREIQIKSALILTQTQELAKERRHLDTLHIELSHNTSRSTSSQFVQTDSQTNLIHRKIQVSETNTSDTLSAPLPNVTVCARLVAQLLLNTPLCTLYQLLFTLEQFEFMDHNSVQILLRREFDTFFSQTHSEKCCGWLASLESLFLEFSRCFSMKLNREAHRVLRNVENLLATITAAAVWCSWGNLVNKDFFLQALDTHRKNGVRQAEETLLWELYETVVLPNLLFSHAESGNSDAFAQVLNSLDDFVPIHSFEFYLDSCHLKDAQQSLATFTANWTIHGQVPIPETVLNHRKLINVKQQLILFNAKKKVFASQTPIHQWKTNPPINQSAAAKVPTLKEPLSLFPVLEHDNSELHVLCRFWQWLEREFFPSEQMHARDAFQIYETLLKRLFQGRYKALIQEVQQIHSDTWPLDDCDTDTLTGALEALLEKKGPFNTNDIRHVATLTSPSLAIFSLWKTQQDLENSNNMQEKLLEQNRQLASQLQKQISLGESQMAKPDPNLGKENNTHMKNKLLLCQAAQSLQLLTDKIQNYRSSQGNSPTPRLSPIPFVNT